MGAGGELSLASRHHGLQESSRKEAGAVVWKRNVMSGESAVRWETWKHMKTSTCFYTVTSVGRHIDLLFYSRSV